MFVIKNEFAMVEVGRDDSAKGTRLMIRDVQTGASIYLDSLELETLTRLQHRDLAPYMDPSFGDETLDDEEEGFL